jgi:FAD/FMN-containing dehydrogenase
MINETISSGEVYEKMVANAEIMEQSIPHLIGWGNRRTARKELAVLRREIDVMERRVGYDSLVAPYVGGRSDWKVEEPRIVGGDGPNEELLDELRKEGMGHVNYEVANKMEGAFESAKKKNAHFLVVDVGQRLYKVLFAVDNFLSRKLEAYWANGRMGDFYRVSNEQREVREEMMPDLIADCQDATDALAEIRGGYNFDEKTELEDDENDADEDWEKFR